MGFHESPLTYQLQFTKGLSRGDWPFEHLANCTIWPLSQDRQRIWLSRMEDRCTEQFPLVINLSVKAYNK